MASEIRQVSGSIGSSFLVPATKWAEGPDFRTIGKLEGILAEMFANTQEVVHIRTDSLRQSGSTSSDFRRAEGIWEGEVTYGGPSTGPINPVDYAIFELARGGDHNFFQDMPAYDVRFGDVLTEFFLNAGGNS